MTSRLQRQIQCNFCHSRMCIERIYNKMGNFEESPSENLKDYFLNFLPTTSFKLSVKNSPRYKQISDIFRIKDTLPFTVYFATDFELFSTKFQSMNSFEI